MWRERLGRERRALRMWLFFYVVSYVGRLFVKANGKPAEILTRLNELAGFALDEEIELFELEDGDIICFQKSSQVESGEQCRCPDVPAFWNMCITVRLFASVLWRNLRRMSSALSCKFFIFLKSYS
ncbi:hypothetical protein TEA_017934 [Camellia sinensis var. sinensis]|uniref:Uncharacterized protein n=1 Tax=Camellia sinensis var. sinensis TaxID=542762 RepID=A0A4S4D957_CAMSN|nr:hypothetical protein TEA_017934 [Camellia sinensis var. sinensis]